MILLGLHIDQAAGHGTMAVLDKKLKNVRHHYTVREARRVSGRDCAEAMARCYHDRRYLTRKSVFSQDRRPRKEVSAHPLIVMAADLHYRAVLEKLRQKNIPVEALFVNEAGTGATTEKDPARPGLGRDREVSAKMLLETTAALLAEQRLVVDMPAAAETTADELSAETVNQALAAIRRGRTLPGENHASLRLALAAPVWYRENNRYRPVYRTSATSTRKYK